MLPVVCRCHGHNCFDIRMDEEVLYDERERTFSRTVGLSVRHISPPADESTSRNSQRVRNALYSPQRFGRW